MIRILIAFPWYAIVSTALVLVSGQLIIGASFLSLGIEQKVFEAQLVGAYVASAILLAIRAKRGLATGYVAIGKTVFLVFGGLSIYIVVKEAYCSRLLLVTSVVLAYLFLFANAFLTPYWRWAIFMASIVGAAILQPMDQRPKELLLKAAGLGSKPIRSQKVINSALYSLQATFYDNYFQICDENGILCKAPRNGGGIALFSDGYLAVTGQGDIHFLKIDNKTRDLSKKDLPYRAPLNDGEFAAEPGIQEKELRVFRVAGVLVQNKGEKFSLFAVHHFWKAKEHCFVERVSKLDGDYGSFIAGTLPEKWETVYETAPCLPIKNIEQSGRGKPFSGEESGGRMLLLNDRTLLLTVGDHQFDGWNSAEPYAQMEDIDYGKILKLDLTSGAVQTYSRGHRNPQGLYRSGEGQIWSTEHGPQGGDELNLIVDGGNYGWPLATYGTDYGKYVWPLAQPAARQDGFRSPVYAWVPSIAVSDVIEVEKNLFEAWKGDLLIGSYSKSLQRARVREGRVVYVEPIQIRQVNGRLRYILEDNDGKLLMWLDSAALVVVEPIGQPAAAELKSLDESARGQLLFAACRSCHNVANGTSHGIGPDLRGIFGRKIASAAGFEYSTALKNLSGSWEEKLLNAFLENPQAVALGSSMQTEAVRNPDDRASLVRYLKESAK